MRAPVFFDASLILHEDPDLLVVNKPSGMPSQSSDPARPDDVVHRAARWMEARDGERPRLGVHQRLDRETSGVMVLAKSERANRSLARQFESRAIRKEYVACVRGPGGKGAGKSPTAWPLRTTPRRLEHTLAELVHGRVEVLRAADPAGRPALADVRLLERRGDRGLVGIELLTGRTHQIRVQLAAIDMPVAGDVLYGRDPAHRLMLHASLLGLEHPEDARPCVFRAKVPSVFRRWLEGEDRVPLDDPRALRTALARALVSRAGLYEARFDDRATDVFRLLHGEGDGVADLAVDVYGEHLVAHFYSTLTTEAENEVLDTLDSLGFRGVYVKRRPVDASRVVDPTRHEVAPSAPLRGEPADSPLVVREHAIPYECRLGEGLSTGIFLDQRENRRRVRDAAAGARVLNLFAYTAAFSSAAASGGARELVSVDASGPALAWGEASYARTGFTVPHRFVRADVFEYLASAADTDARFELVVCDPPTYSTTKHGRWASGADWTRLAIAVLRVAAPGGTVFFCSNDRRMSERAFRQRILAAVETLGITARLRAFDPPNDHPRAAGSEATMKTLRVRL